jgi:hypothetical protein
MDPTPQQRRAQHGHGFAGVVAPAAYLRRCTRFAGVGDFDHEVARNGQVLTGGIPRFNHDHKAFVARLTVEVVTAGQSTVQHHAGHLVQARSLAII